MHAQWWDNSTPVNVPVSVTVWVSENDGTILASNSNVAISKSGSGGEPTSFTIAVTGAYTGVQWYLGVVPVTGSRGTAQSLTLDAADYAAGTYILGVTVTNNGVPYSTDIRFTVSN
jgi:hypothetical protein